MGQWGSGAEAETESEVIQADRARGHEDWKPW